MGFKVFGIRVWSLGITSSKLGSACRQDLEFSRSSRHNGASNGKPMEKSQAETGICQVRDGVVLGIEEDYSCLLVFVSLGRL